MMNFTHTKAGPDLLFGTPLTIVVRARAEYADGSRSSDLGLVIARQHCTGDVPSQRALRIAARASLRRLNADGSVRRLLICVGGHWLPLICGVRPEAAEADMAPAHACWQHSAGGEKSLPTIARANR